MRTPRALLWVLTVAALAAPATAAGQEPIPEGPGAESFPRFLGRQAVQRPVQAPLAPQHPFMARDPWGNIHNDAYMTDAYPGPGPLGRDPSSRSTFLSSDCASVTFDRRGRIVTICVGLDRPTLRLLDPVTLATLAAEPLPPRQLRPGQSPFNDFSGGGYFYLDHEDRAVVVTTDRHIRVYQTEERGFRLVRDVDLNGPVGSQDALFSVLPDWSGRLWFISLRGVVGTVDAAGAIRVLDTGEQITNSFAVDDEGGVYIVTDAALYRFDAAADGSPSVTWRETYANVGTQKPGQASPGSGTTPTVMAGGLVAITDNGDPMSVVVLRRGRSVAGARRVCSIEVFDRGRSATDNSLIAAGSSLVVENNFGYSGPAATQQGRSTEPGIERIAVDAAAGTCRSVWRSSERAPTVVPKLSLLNGLIYVYTKEPRSDGEDLWYLTALDFRTGETIWRILAGEGLGYNNNYAPITLGPDGTAYVGVLGGLVRIADATPPPGAASSSPGGPGAGGGQGAGAGRQCLSPRLFVRARSIGPVRLDMTRPTLGVLGARVGRRSARFCVRGGGTVRVAMDRRGRAAFLVSTARGHSPGRVRPGSTVRALRRRFPRARRVVAGVVRSGPRGRLLFGVRRGRVRWVAVAPLRTGPRAVRSRLRAVGLRRSA